MTGARSWLLDLVGDMASEVRRRMPADTPPPTTVLNAPPAARRPAPLPLLTNLGDDHTEVTLLMTGEDNSLSGTIVAVDSAGWLLLDGPGGLLWHINSAQVVWVVTR